jgi:hypothetical protein
MPHESGEPATTGDVGARLTYAQIAERLGISGEAARQLVRRRGWRRILPNRQGAPAVIVVTDDELAAEQWREHRATPPSVGATAEAVEPPTPGSEAAVETVLAALREAHAGEIGRLIEALATERERVDALIASHRSEIVAVEAKLTAETARADAAGREAHGLSNRVMVLLRDVDRAAAEADALRAEAEVAEAKLATARTAAQDAREQLDAYRREDAERKARGLLVRLRDALRGK